MMASSSIGIPEARRMSTIAAVRLGARTTTPSRIDAPPILRQLIHVRLLRHLVFLATQRRQPPRFHVISTVAPLMVAVIVLGTINRFSKQFQAGLGLALHALEHTEHFPEPQ